MNIVLRKVIKRHTLIGVGLMFVTLGLISLEGCTSTRKLVYFQGATNHDDTLAIPKLFVPIIRRGDVLSVQVSSLNPEASAFFNPTAMADAGSTATTANPLIRSAGYLVDSDGKIKLPLIGQVSVVDSTNASASELISNKLKVYLKEPSVTVRNLNFRISVLGEVARPALFTIPNEQVTLPEALGLAGDLTIYGRRDNILIIREEGNERVFARLNLTQRDSFKSPYYSLHPNDVIYVEPGKVRATTVDKAYLLAPIAIGILSLIAIIATRQ